MSEHIEPESLPRVDIPLNRLVAAPSNPNRMAPHKYAALVEFIRRHGFNQEIVVWQPSPERNEWEIVDGHHRVKALRELWDARAFVPARDATALTAAERRELMLSLNNNRGELDLGMVSKDIDFLLGQGRTIDDLALVTGFDELELEALVGATIETTEEDLLEDALVTERERPSDKRDKVFTLEIVLASAKELRTAKNRLRRAGGKGNKDLAKGFRALAGLDGDDR